MGRRRGAAGREEGGIESGEGRCACHGTGEEEGEGKRRLGWVIHVACGAHDHGLVARGDSRAPEACTFGAANRLSETETEGGELAFTSRVRVRASLPV